jgi:hypothetical protein
VAVADIATGEITRGSLPVTAARLVNEWRALNRDALMRNWQLIRSGEPFERIAGLNNAAGSD